MNENFMTNNNNDDDLILVSNDCNITITSNDIIERLKQEASSHNLLDDEAILGCATSLFNIILMNVGKTLIKPSRVYFYNKNGRTSTNIDVINKLCDIYIYICYIYNKGLSLSAFKMFLGLGINYINNSDIYGLDEALSQIAVRINKSDNELQQMNARDSHQAILNIAYNNYRHAWNGDIRANEIKSSIKTLDDIRRERELLGDSSESITQ